MSIPRTGSASPKTPTCRSSWSVPAPASPLSAPSSKNARPPRPASKNWLFFGDQQKAVDFLYEQELEAYKNDGILTRLYTAFSRDQKEKFMSRTRMLEHADELWKWLNEGAHFYVCGDAKRMATDVDNALKKIVAEKGGMSPEEAKAYVTDLSKSKRYQRDVY